MRGLKVPLSTNEEITLQRIAIGSPSALPVTDVARLEQLGLIEPGIGATWTLTLLGRQRYAGLRRPAPDNETGRMLASFQRPKEGDGG